MRVKRYDRSTGFNNGIFCAKTGKSLSPKKFGNYSKNDYNSLRLFSEQKMLLVSTSTADSKHENKHVSPFTLKQIRGYDFGQRVLQVEYLPNCRKHILNVRKKGIVVLDHLTGHYTLVGEELRWESVFVKAKPDWCTS